ncbi:MAG: CoA-binding protein [Thermoplasmata archaeon]|nr:MAG: CoA-binding protein [Thermoplasmata archaeon]
MVDDFTYLFNPRHVAIIGASHHKEKIGYKVLDNIITSGYKGKIYPVNPKGGKILGLKVYKDIFSIEGEIDLAIIVVPASIAVNVVEECAKRGVKFAVVITSGFSEIGNIDGERAMVEKAKKYGMRILGPNVFGIYSAIAPINATFGPSKIRPGNIAVISQSGALGIAMIGKASEENMGLSTIVSIGNKADVTEAEILSYLFKDKPTKVVFLYMEGIENGLEFLELAKRRPEHMSIVALKAGRSRVGARAVASHTGSLAGSDKIFDAAFKEAGILRAESLEEAFNWVITLAACPKPQGKNVVIVTNGGGVGVLAADACEKYGIYLLDDMEILKKTFQDVMPEFGSYKNPVDITGQATGEDYEKALERALKEESIHAIIALYCETNIAAFEPVRDAFLEMQKKYGKKKPIIYSLFGGEGVATIIKDLKKKGIPAFDDVEDAVSALSALYKAYQPRKKEKMEKVEMNKKRIRKVLDRARKEGRAQLLGTEAKEVIKSAGLDVPPFEIVNDIEGAVKAAEKIGYPVVMKVVSEDIIHKTDVGGVFLDLDDKNEVIEAYEAIRRNIHQHAPKADVRGIEITKMLPPGIEIIIGITTDSSFGKVVMFGLGGIYVEVLKDVSFRVLPVTKNEIRRMIREVSSYPLLLGVRGEERKDIESVVDAIYRIGVLAVEFPEIVELDVNPLVVYKKGAKVLDGRIAIKVGK